MIWCIQFFIIDRYLINIRKLKDNDKNKERKIQAIKRRKFSMCEDEYINLFPLKTKQIE